MFYSEVILARKGPLGKIWLAAHFDKKLTRNQIFATDISSSVESVLNPASPLALRVSGHLMLGIVRIYSRKVSYLVTECNEMMWKIKLAFRPGNFDIDPSVATAVNIHDTRHFGNIDMENEIPGLENIEFNQMLLPEQDLFKFDSTQFSEASFFGGHTINDFSNVAESPLIRASSKISRNLSDSSSRFSHVSDLEMTRFERNGSLSSAQGQSRASLSAAKDARPSGISFGMSFEDDIPAFQEHGIDMDQYAPAEMLDFGADNSYIPPYEGEFDNRPFEEEKGSPLLQQAENRKLNRVMQLQEHDGIRLESMDGEGEVPRLNDGVALKQRRVVKRRRVVIDDRVELPARILKQRMDDLGPILRQKRGSYFQIGVRTVEIGSIRGLCSELREVFEMSTNVAPLPFPLKEGLVEASVNERDRAPLEHREEQEIYDDMEITRAPRSSELSSARRASELNASSIGGKDESLTMGDDGLANFSQGSRARDSFADIDLGGGGFDDFGGGFDAPLSFRDSSPGPGSAAEGGKRGAWYSQVQRTTTTAISELVTTALSRGSPGYSKGSGNSSHDRSEESHHTRTEQFMDILRGEFESKPSVTFEEVTSGVSKRVAAVAFLEVLQLKTWGRIVAKQASPFQEISLALPHGGSL